MLIVCPSCATSYGVELASLGPQGRQVRCSRCHMTWHAAPARADQLLAAAQAIAPALATELAVDGGGAEPPGEPAVEAPRSAFPKFESYHAALSSL